ncbi:MFS transporter [Companilactobacillus alimentarius]|uniref:MFS transporter n=1 Tax=Companilactobacillus alimentarius DSM 20249 TaxID=1423720 RepID=A0A2K9HEK9_9LACO|nr:MFS transporter [Companilactobacillus alimentarius]AUI70989.1 MFS transporter [Companilactobacillus alimentarius DSM 20249]KRK75103.1 drug H(+) antiporter [Companilactobacillus alimentarius DSM 20249]GEO44123.1 MFS transporter [Companilactobacillus alimentarius]
MNEKVNPRRWMILISVGIFTLMATLDGSIVNIALPIISKNLHIEMNMAEWVVSIYLVTICIFLLMFGKIADSIGKIKIFKIGSVMFILGSIICGLSNNLVMLLLGRVVQAIGASMAMATNNGIITQTFPLSERGYALGYIGSFVSIGAIAGPGIGGLILGHFHWSYIFWINIPIGLIALILGYINLPKAESTNPTKFDKRGFAVYFLTLLLFFGAIFIGQSVGFTNLYIILTFIVAVGCFFLFLQIEKSVTDPMIELRIFSNHNFTLGLVAGFFIFVTNFFFNVVSPFYLENALGIAASTAGYILMAFPVVQVVVAPISGKISAKVNPIVLTIIGLIVIEVAQIGYLFFNLQTQIWFILLCIGLNGLGNGLFQAPNNTMIMSSVETKDLGIAGGLNALSRNLGMIIGVSLSTTVLFLSMSKFYGKSVTTYINGRPDIFIDGMRVTMTFAVIICLIAIVMSVIRLIKSGRSNNE